MNIKAKNKILIHIFNRYTVLLSRELENMLSLFGLERFGHVMKCVQGKQLVLSFQMRNLRIGKHRSFF